MIYNCLPKRPVPIVGSPLINETGGIASMEIDPVVVLADELRATEAALRAAMRRYEKSRKRENGSAVDSLLESVKTLRRDIF